MHTVETRKQKGFTIVELLIVIVVIGIIAAIVIVAYTGIQTRTKNARTVNAVSSYIKLINLYKVHNGTHPPVSSSCLGTGYPDGACRSDGWLENGNSLNTSYLSEYLKGPAPTPDMTPMQYSSTLTMAGAWYAYANASYSATGGGVGVMILGSGACSSIGGAGYMSSTSTVDGKGKLCRYSID